MELLLEKLKTLPINYEAILKHCPINREPIFYCDIKYYLLVKKKKFPLVANKIVVKGIIEDIKKKKRIKLAVAKAYFGGDKEASKKAHSFELNRIEVREIIINRFLGYSIKES